MLLQNFMCDYLEGAHPKIMTRLAETNLEKTPGYGMDPYCESAKEKIRAACGCPRAQVWFLVGGTQTNATVIDALLRPWQGVVCAETGHIGTHEAGAVEAGGHKVLTLPHHDGKIDAGEAEAYFLRYEADENREHTVEPGMVYISHPTEYGTLYTKAEMEALNEVCRRHGVLLYLDGARLGYGLAAEGTDVTLSDLSRLCDAFYIGGTKVGALFGEAVVFPDESTAPRFFTLMKQHGALLAKGRMLGIQFDTLFTDGLYFEISRHAIQMARILREGLAQKGYPLLYGSPTNQIFTRLENKAMHRLSETVGFSYWEADGDAHTIVRFATSWATREEDVYALLELL